MAEDAIGIGTGAKLRIRPATAKDRAAIQRIYSRCLARARWFASRPGSKPDIARDSAGEVLHVAVGEDGRILGFVSVYERDSFIHHLFVNPEAQGHGVGTMLLRSLEPWLPFPWGLKCVAANTEAMRFYLERGWIAAGCGTGEQGDYALLALVREELWRCPRCGRAFANRNQSHACGLHDLEHHFEGKSAAIRALYEAFVKALRSIGPVTVLPEKTRIAFQVRMSFAQLTPRLRWMDGHLVLARRFENARFRKIETFSPRNHLYHFRLHSASELDAEFRAWLKEAYAVGAQEHLRTKARAG